MTSVRQVLVGYHQALQRQKTETYPYSYCETGLLAWDKSGTHVRGFRNALRKCISVLSLPHYSSPVFLGKELALD